MRVVIMTIDMRHSIYMLCFEIAETSEACQYHSAIFSPNFEYFVLQCLGPGIPIVSLYKSELPTPIFLAEIQRNTVLKVIQKLE